MVVMKKLIILCLSPFLIIACASKPRMDLEWAELVPSHEFMIDACTESGAMSNYTNKQAKAAISYIYSLYSSDKLDKEIYSEVYEKTKRDHPPNAHNCAIADHYAKYYINQASSAKRQISSHRMGAFAALFGVGSGTRITQKPTYESECVRTYNGANCTTRRR